MRKTGWYKVRYEEEGTWDFAWYSAPYEVSGEFWLLVGYKGHFYDDHFLEINETPIEL